MRFDKTILKIADDVYQRKSLGQKKINDIARNFDFKLLGTLQVVRRSDGTLWVFDGGHRLRAALKRSDITLLPCMVYEVNSIVEEARAFFGTNTLNSKVSSFCRYRAMVIAEEPNALIVRDILEQNGYIPSVSIKNKGFSALNTLYNAVKLDKSNAKKTFSLCAKIEKNGATDALSKYIFEGFYYLSRHLDENDYEKLANIALSFDIKVFSKSINNKAIILGNSRTKLTCALGILDVINKKTRKKIRINNENAD
jgi:hypothetical protein